MFDAVISSLVFNAVKSSVKSSVRIDSLISELKEACPSQQKLRQLIDQKNQLSQALNLVQTNLTTLTSISSTAENIINVVDPIVKTIKSLPFPVAVGGFGVPANLLIKLSDTLELLKDLIKQGKLSVKGIISAFKIITNNINDVQNKLNVLDSAIALCASQISYTGSLGLNSNGTNSNPLVNIFQNQNLENKLSANSNDPLYYKEWRLILQTDPNNKFSFPRRRVIATKPNGNSKGQIILTSNFGLDESQGYSYSSDIEVLVNDIKFKIDNPNWKPTSIINEFNEVLDEAAAEAQKAKEEATKIEIEAKRGTVKFYRDSDFQTPVGNYFGYTEGDYEDIKNYGLFYQPIEEYDSEANQITSIKIGRGLRLTIYKSTNFLIAPGESNTPEGIDNSYDVFEHPLDSSNEYLEIPYLYGGFGDNLRSFRIQNLIGGKVIENPPIKEPIESSIWVLKRRSLATLRNSSYEWLVTVDRYNVYVKKDNSNTNIPPNTQNINQYKSVRASTELEAKNLFSDIYGLNGGVWKSSTFPNFQNIIYSTTLIGIQSFNNTVNSVGTYTAIDNNDRIYYIEKIS